MNVQVDIVTERQNQDQGKFCKGAGCRLQAPGSDQSVDFIATASLVDDASESAASVASLINFRQTTAGRLDLTVPQAFLEEAREAGTSETARRAATFENETLVDVNLVKEVLDVPLPSGSVNAFGDPHMKNVRGEKFEVRKPGVHTFLDVPQGSTADSVLLRVDALVKAEATKCSAMFIKRVDIAGRWLGTTPPLTFSAGTGPAGQADRAGLTVGNSSYLTVEEFLSHLPPAMIKLTLPTNAFVAPTLANHHVTGMTAAMKFASGVGLKVSWVSELTPHKALASSLWVSATGLSSVREPIGGLLGIDDHYLASKPEADCGKRAGLVWGQARRDGFMVASASMEQ
jgi:hypothetical protein